MKTKIYFAVLSALSFTILCATLIGAQPSSTPRNGLPSRPKGPCDIYAAASDPCVAAHSTTRALYASYDGPLYQVLRKSDGKTLDISVVAPVASPFSDAGGYADAAAQDKFCANTYCWISKVYDQSPKHNDLTQAPRGGFSGPALGGFNNLPLADAAPITIMGHKAYGVFIEPGMGIRNDDPRGTAVDDQAEGQYWVINGLHFNSGCCFDYGNAEIDSRDDDNGTMETTYYGDSTPWFHGNPPGPWVMTDQENNLVGCVNSDESKLCVTLPSINWRFVTAMAKGEPHHWTSMGGNAQEGPLSVVFDGLRVNSSYDPMRKQGAILLGNGGDNSNRSQGTFYEGAMTASGTFPSNATDQLVQANVVTAGYGPPRLSLAPALATKAPSGLQTFTPGSSQQATVTFTNTTGAPVANVVLSIAVPGGQWHSVAEGSNASAKTFVGPVATGSSVSANFKITSGPVAYNGDLIGKAAWKDASSNRMSSEATVEKVRNASPIKINEFRIGGPKANATDSFIELYNAGATSVDLANWTLTVHPTQQAISSEVKIPAGTKIAPHAFYLLGLSNSGLAISAGKGDGTLYLRSTTEMSVGDTILIGSGAMVESRKIAKVGTLAGIHTTLWQPLPDGPVITIPRGSTNVPVASVSDIVAGEKIALGYGVRYPSVGSEMEQFEVVTVTAVGKPGTQAYLAADAAEGSTNIKVTSVENISTGDKIRLDIDSTGHGIETVEVTNVGSKAIQTNLTEKASPGATSVKVRRIDGLKAGDKITVGTPTSGEEVTITSLERVEPRGSSITFNPALRNEHGNDEWVLTPGTGLDVAAPLKFSHSANLPFSDRGTGISFEPATAFAHASNEPIRALGTGVTLDHPLASAHEIDAVVQDAKVTTAGYQGNPKPNQWFGGPELMTSAPLFGRIINVREGSIVLRDATGVVADSLNYGGLVDPWAAEGYQANRGPEHSGCHAPAPGSASSLGPPLPGADANNTSAGRFPDGADTDSNCGDFMLQAFAPLSVASVAGATNIKVASVAGFEPGQKVMIDGGTGIETAIIASVGTAGATTSSTATSKGATLVPVASTIGFREGQTITMDSGANAETVVIASIPRFPAMAITVSKPLQSAHAAGAQIAGSGITLAAALSRAHALGAPVTNNVPTPGAPNLYSRKTP